MKVSIIVPVYNTERYLERCLDSIIKQTYKSIEVIIVNDGSSDNSLRIIENYSKIDERIKVINQENKGLVIARYNGIELATGEYCMFVDSDDWIELDTVEKLVKKIKSNRVDMVKYRFIQEPSKIKQSKILEGEDIVFEPKNKQKLYHILFTTSRLNNLANEIVKKDLFDNRNCKKNINQAEDFLINLEIFYKAKRILITNDIYYHYYINNNSITHKIDKQHIIKKIQDLVYVYNVTDWYLNKYKLENDEKLIKTARIRNINVIADQVSKLLMCEGIKKDTLIQIQKELEEKNFYTLIEKIQSRDIKNRNLIKQIIGRNILNKRMEKNYKYRYIFLLVKIIRRKNEDQKSNI